MFNLHRTFDPKNSLGFGYGAHRCIAEELAKTELEIVFGQKPSPLVALALADNSSTASLFQKLPNLNLAIPLNEVEYSPPTKDIGIAKLPVIF